MTPEQTAARLEAIERLVWALQDRFNRELSAPDLRIAHEDREEAALALQRAEQRLEQVRQWYRRYEAPGITPRWAELRAILWPDGGK